MSSSDTTRALDRIDRFYGGRFVLHQPQGSGFRAGLDALLLAATVPRDFCGQGVDLGAGAGAVALAAASRAPGLALTLVERDERMCALATRSLADPANSDLAGRLRLVALDVLSTRGQREDAGLCDGAFSLVLTNPPFYPADGRASPDALRRSALTLASPDMLRRWLRVAAALIAPRGRLHVILRPADLALAVAALENRLGGLCVLPVHTRPGAATRVLISAVRGSRQPLRLLPGVALYDGEGPTNALSRGVADGLADLDLFDAAR